MKGGGSSVIPVYAGIRFDIEMLLTKFKQRGSPRFTVFRTVFQSVSFGKIFVGRLAPAELVEFSERLLQMSASYMHPNRKTIEPVYMEELQVMDGGDEMPRPLLERMFGVYLTYSLYFLQPSNYVVQVSVTPVQLDSCHALFRELLEGNHLDAVACLMKLMFHQAFRVVAFGSSYDPTSHKRYELSQEDDDNPADFFEPPFADLAAFKEDPLLKQLELLPTVQPSINFNYNTELEKIKDIIEHGLYASIPTVSVVQTDEKGEPLPAKGSSNRADIKDRAYQGDITHNRNRRYADPNLVVGANIQDQGEEEGEETAGSRRKKRRLSKKKQKLAEEKLDKPPVMGATDDMPVVAENSASSSVPLIADMESAAEKATPMAKKPKKMPTRPKVKDSALEASIRASTTRTKKQLANDKLLEELKNIPDV